MLDVSEEKRRKFADCVKRDTATFFLIITKSARRIRGSRMGIPAKSMELEFHISSRCEDTANVFECVKSAPRMLND
jgi:hypothetical protein